MMRPALSPAAAGLLRAILGRASFDRDRIFLTEFRSVDWQSLTFSGERHEIRLRLSAPFAQSLLDRLTQQLAEAEWQVPGHLVADIAVHGSPRPQPDGSILLDLEALTIAA